MGTPRWRDRAVRSNRPKPSSPSTLGLLEYRPALLYRHERVRPGQNRRTRVIQRLHAGLGVRRGDKARHGARRELARDAQRDANDDERRRDALACLR